MREVRICPRCETREVHKTPGGESMGACQPCLTAGARLSEYWLEKNMPVKKGHFLLPIQRWEK